MRPQTRLSTIVDTGPGDRDTTDTVGAVGSTPPDCANASSADQRTASWGASFAVQDVG